MKPADEMRRALDTIIDNDWDTFEGEVKKFWFKVDIEDGSEDERLLQVFARVEEAIREAHAAVGLCPMMFGLYKLLGEEKAKLSEAVALIIQSGREAGRWE